MDNAWVESYLEALLSSGLSGEYVGQRKHAHNATLSDPDKDIYAQYYVQQILNTDEEGIVSAWQKAQAGGPGPKDARLEYLAWRVWSMHQRRKRMRRGEDETPATSPKSYDGGSVTPLTMSYESRSGMYMDRHYNKSPMTPLQPAQGDSVSSSPQRASAMALSTPLRVKVDKTVRIKVDDSALVSPSPMSAQATPAPQTLFAGRVDKLYVVLISIHGLVRGEKMELGKDADTGGQVKYVVELAKNLALHPMVHRVDLLTRLIQDPKVDDSYGEEEEMLLKGDGELGGAFITRIKCGDPKVYLPKEELWPHVREFADNAMMFLKGMLSKMTAAGEPCDLYAVHGHYADGGEVAALVSHTLDVEMVLTGHSLGRNKLDHLLKSGTVTRKQIEETYKISRRIEAEERALDAAIMVLSSTQQEIDLQWGLYDGWDPKVANAVRYRRRVGRHMPNMVVIPPGLQFSTYKVELPSDPMKLYDDYREAMMDKSLTMFSNVQNQNTFATTQYPTGPSDLSELDSSPPPPAKHAGPGALAQAFNNVSLSARVGATGTSFVKRTGSHMSLGRTESEGGGRITRNTSHVSLADRDPDGHARGGPSVPGSVMGAEDANIPPIWKEIQRFLRVPYKPVVLAMSRPDAKKNIITLVKAFGSNPILRNLANLVLIMGNRDNIDSLNKGSQNVLMQVLKLIDAHDLYGSVAYPKSHEQSDISDIYHFVTRTRGVFTNIALQEPFGLTLIEAAVHGAPIVATKHGGPVDIIRTLKNGKLVEPTNVEEVSKAIVDVLRDSVMWETCSRNGINNILAYSWPSHCIQYLECIEKEKLRLSRRQKGHRHSWDGNEVSFSRDMEKSGANSPSGTSGRLLAQSILQGDHNHMASITPEALDRISCPVNIAVPVADSAPPVLSTATSGVNDDIVTAAVRAVDAVPPSVMLAGRERLAFAVLDNSGDIDQLVTVLSAAMKAKGDAVGLGLLTVFTFPEILDLLSSKGFDAKQLDFIVVNSGAYIMCINSNGDWIGDEAWDHKVTTHWDKQLVMRTLTRMTMSKARSDNEDEVGNVMKVLQRESATEADDGSGPMHCLLHLSAEENSPLAAVDNHTLLGYVRKRVRSLGIRCNLTLQLVPRSGENAISILHATPLRASRAMALRHLFMAHGIDMSKSTFLCTPATIAKNDAGTVLGALCSDMDSLVQGAYKVLIVPPSRSVEKEIEVKKDATAFERLKVSLAPYTCERVQVVSDAQEASDKI